MFNGRQFLGQYGGHIHDIRWGTTVLTHVEGGLHAIVVVLDVVIPFIFPQRWDVVVVKQADFTQLPLL